MAFDLTRSLALQPGASKFALAHHGNCWRIGATQHSGVFDNVCEEVISTRPDNRVRTACSMFLFRSTKRLEDGITMTLDPERLASLLETAPVGAVARLTLLSETARHEAARTVARHLCDGLRHDDRDQLRLPL